MAQQPTGNPTEYVTVEIYDQTYHLSGQNADHIRELAACVDAKMRAVAAQGRTVDSLRVAVLAALNLADELALNASRATPAPPICAASSMKCSTSNEKPDPDPQNRLLEPGPLASGV
jgi:cell division protein ZapA (FtsZ GTPase activity inhibitor)